MEQSYRGRSYLGNRTLSSTKLSRLPQNESRYLTSQSTSTLESRDEILFRGEGCDTSGVQLLEHKVLCAFWYVYPCVKVKKNSVQSKGIYVIIQNYQPLFAKSFNIGSIFKFMKGFLANMLVIITWQLYCILAQIWCEFAIKKQFFSY